MKRNNYSVTGAVLFALLAWSPIETANAGANQNESRFVYLTGGTQPVETARSGANQNDEDNNDYDPVIHWNQVFIDTIFATSTANSVSQRLAAIVHVAMFDSYNGITHRWTPIFMDHDGPRNGSRRAAVVQAAYRTLSVLFTNRQAELDAELATAMAHLGNGRSVDRGLEWGNEVALAVLDWRSVDGFAVPIPSFTGGTAVGQWRPTPPAFGPMSSQTIAFTIPFAVFSPYQFRPPPPRGLTNATYTDDFNAVKALGRRTDSTRTPDQTELAAFWEFNATIHWNDAANQIARANETSLQQNVRLFALLNLAHADSAITTWSSKRYYGAQSNAVTWRPVHAIPLADTDGNPDTLNDPDWLPLITTPSHPEYGAGHPSLNGAAAAVLAANFDDAQTFTLFATGLPNRTYTSISAAESDGNNARVWGGMHYPSTVAISSAYGHDIAHWINENRMQLRVGNSDHD